jgi:type III pantothenate kinase
MLAIDVGNTFIKAAVMDNEGVNEKFYLHTETCISKNTYFPLVNINKVPGDSIVIASVRKPVLDIIRNEALRLFGKSPFIVDISTDMGLKNLYLTPGTLGVDRLVTSAAAWHLYSQDHRALITVDMGTATTLDLISANGEFIGGVIAPGLESALAGLLGNAPELPRVAIEKVERLVGRTTVECMSSGAVASHAAMIRGLADMIDRHAVVVVTGGMANSISNWLNGRYIIDEDLMFKGLKIIHERNLNT